MAQDENLRVKSKPSPELTTTSQSMEPPMSKISTMIPTTSWFTPKRLLAIFCVINLLNYLDRGAIASNGVNGSRGTCTEDGTCTSGTGIQGDFNLNNFEDGVLSSAFLVGLLVACPIFASLAKSVNPFRLIGVGLSVWTLATLCCGLSFNFWSISVCRMLVGFGEASFISLAAPFIDDNAPVAQKTAWLAIFYMCIPTGYALGYVYGGLVGSYFGWRYAFWVESVLMLPFAISGFFMNPLQLKGFVSADSEKALAPETVSSEVQVTDASNGKDESLSLKEEFSHSYFRSKSTTKIFDQFSRFLNDMKELLLDEVYVVNVLGYIAYNFVIGAYSYWGPKAGYNIYHMTDADLIFGGITIFCGIVGTLAGGFVLDFMTNTLSNAFKLLSVTTFIGAAFCFGAFLFRSMYGFLALFSIGELLVFATQGPVNYVCLRCVKPSLRPLSMALSTVAIHVFGDVPSSPLVGVLQDNINNWRTTALILTAILFPAAGIWFIGIFLRSVDRFNEDNEHQVSTVESSDTMPLLQEMTGETSASPAQSQEC
ncbi:probable sphingolipid transporter spinster homolog 2 isoform X2 [Gastrolobium bilobum]|uniref:probable sphingolipid transporter spinster homolog 2 isoform X2 n=1 Tax=Gastrolobium bilobum TaxID=150636 RepID=UPI002AB0D774|nr:probable sphingolipid transporter spinster homolog 2 isoform X2 [Gastrolobium bilobum]